MSTYCIRVYEVKEPSSGKWVKIGERVDNYHGFDSWHFKYSNRGIPNDSSIERNSLIEDDGTDYTFNHSYVTYEELNTLSNEINTNIKNRICDEMEQCVKSQLNNKITNRIDFIAGSLLTGCDWESYSYYFIKDKKDDIDEDYNKNYKEYFNDFVEECLEERDELNGELYILSGLVDSYVENYNNDKDITDKIYSCESRIVFYFA